MAINPKPWLRVIPLGPIEEPASTFFSLVILLVILQMARGFRLSLKTAESRVLSYSTYVLVGVWAVTYAMSTLFHTHENVFTERMDYFMPVFAMMSQFVSGIVAVSPWVRHNAAVALPAIVLPLLLFACYFMYSMHFIRFDYGWQNRVVGLFLVLQLLVWLPWCVLNVSRYPYVKFWFLGHLCLILGAPFELFDFGPVWSTFDGHSLWHGAGVAVTYCLFRFSVANTNRLIVDSIRIRLL